ncbi:hypothetical protein MRX96_054133 [Rhipicephalus microplus]
MAIITTPSAATDNESKHNLWGSRLANTNRAANLVALFSTRNEVMSAKCGVISKMLSAHSSGFRPMSTGKAPENCTQRGKTIEMSARTLFLERTKHAASGAPLKPQETGAVSSTRKLVRRRLFFEKEDCVGNSR